MHIRTNCAVWLWITIRTGIYYTLRHQYFWSGLEADFQTFSLTLQNKFTCVWTNDIYRKYCCLCICQVCTYVGTVCVVVFVVAWTRRNSSVNGRNAVEAQFLDVLEAPVLGSLKNNQQVVCVNCVKYSFAVVVSGTLQGTVSWKMPLMWINYFRIGHGRRNLRRRVASCSLEVSIWN